MCVSVVSAGDGLLRLGSTDFCQQCFGSFFFFFNQKGLQSRTELYTLQLILKVSLLLLLLLLLLFLFFFSLPYFFLFFEGK